MFLKLSIFIAFLSCVNSLDMTMAEELLQAQRELTIAHEFTEIYMEEFYMRWVDNITLLTENVTLPGFFDARSEILTIIDETFDFINTFESSSCRDEVHRRWKSQTTIIGSRLQFCMREAHRIMKGEFDDVNLHLPRGQQVAAHTPNQGLNILSQSSIFEPSGTIYRKINNWLRVLLGRAMPWVSIMDELEALKMHHIEFAGQMIRRCYTMVVGNFKGESISHKQRVENC